MPASASAPAMTLNSFGIEPERVCEDESAAASVTAATAGLAAGVESGWVLAARSSVAGGGAVVEFTPDGSGQRDATTDRCASAPALSSLTGASAGMARTGASLWRDGSIAVCAGSSACASAIERWAGVSTFGAIGLVAGEEFGGAVCDSL